MVTQSNIHFFTIWAKERLDEMDAAVTSLEGKLAEVQADARDKAQRFWLTCVSSAMTSGTPLRSSRKLTRPLGSRQRQN